MFNLRWKRLIGVILLLLVSQATVANTIYSSVVLTEANNLVEVVPQRAKQLVTDYLNQRKLTDQSEQSPSASSRDNSEGQTRTPGSTIDALRILALAEYHLGNQHSALKKLSEASALAQSYNLPYLKLGVELVEIQMLWWIQGNIQTSAARLDTIAQQIEQLDHTKRLAQGLRYRLTMMRAELASASGDIATANQYYQEVKPYLNNLLSDDLFIEYHLQVGKHLIANNNFNGALSELLYSYWKAIEVDAGKQLAEVNAVLGQLFYDRRVLDKASVHFSQAADYYDNYENSPLLAPILKRMGDIYYHQGKYNLALVHFFNAMDHERIQNNIESVIEIRISLAATYLHLVNYPLAEQYLERAQELLQYADIPRLKAFALLLEAGLARHQHIPEAVLSNAEQALTIAEQLDNTNIKKSAYRLLYLGYELQEDYKTALGYLERYSALASLEQQQLDLVSEDAFRQQKEFVEQTLHLQGQKEQLEQTFNDYRKFQKIALSLFIVSILLWLLLLRRGHITKVLKREVKTLSDNLYTHSRSGLKNLRMLNAKLPVSLERSQNKFEQWQVGELIHEPLNDRLRFVMIDVPFLRNMYLQHGYEEGLKLERAFGEYLKSCVESPARIYHFSDANLLYIEPNGEDNTTPEMVFQRIQNWIDGFKTERTLNRIIRIGMADYPFLPRAYTAVNDKELIDVLLMSTSTARTLSMKEHASQWVYLKAIENAPAASLATGNIRKACKHSINQGLIKVQSSYKNEDSIKKLLKGE